MIQAINPATPSDYPEMADLWEASVRETHDFLAEDFVDQVKPDLASRYFPMVEHLYCVKDAADHILGFLGTAEDNIEMLFLHPRARGLGIGRQLIQYAIRELGATKVDVNEQNPQAVGFYERMGFKVVSRSELDGQGNPYPLLHMELNPSPFNQKSTY